MTKTRSPTFLSLLIYHGNRSPLLGKLSLCFYTGIYGLSGRIGRGRRRYTLNNLFY